MSSELRKSKAWLLSGWKPGPAFNLAPNWVRVPMQSSHVNNFGVPATIEESAAHANSRGQILYIVTACKSKTLDYVAKSCNSLEEAKQYADEHLLKCGFTLLDHTAIFGLV